MPRHSKFGDLVGIANIGKLSDRLGGEAHSVDRLTRIGEQLLGVPIEGAVGRRNHVANNLAALISNKPKQPTRQTETHVTPRAAIVSAISAWIAFAAATSSLPLAVSPFLSSAMPRP